MRSMMSLIAKVGMPGAFEPANEALASPVAPRANPEVALLQARIQMGPRLEQGLVESPTLAVRCPHLPCTA